MKEFSVDSWPLLENLSLVGFAEIWHSMIVKKYA